ncbi:HAD family hydrolase [Leucobacter ruminantium]|uniref:HAD-IA family hydrolase n=1 Tax=Leucobacter ruminantium TaxID=1289170 RepID=A0A939LWP8_9MICO|nr:HAD-IA family hydrolase [Leucobacter ruminantium]MBO1803777.1 HAD-IA family hydrolase [Leucobacter ruminantium]
MIDRYDAYLFDLDGVLTPTVDLHMRAWAETFDRFFAERGLAPYGEDEYYASLDGRPRFAGVATLLAARGIVLPEGSPDDDGFASVTGIGNRKNRMFSELLERDGIDPYPGSLRLLDALAAVGKPLAVVSSSRNAEPVLRASGLRDRFAAVVDGVVAAREGLPGKPAPDTFLRASELLGAAPGRSAVFEDAGSGVAAARAGGFGLVVGVDRGAGAEELRLAGADTVVNDLEECLR